MNRLISALGETSTWRGLISILTALGVVLSPEQAAAIIAGGLALNGLINVFRKEPCKTDIIDKKTEVPQ
jgi:hypothetical protein